MRVPETAMDEENGPQSMEHKVGGTWQIATMKPESEAQRMHQLSDDALRRRVLCLDGSHQPAALGYCQAVHGVMMRLERL